MSCAAIRRCSCAVTRSRQRGRGSIRFSPHGRQARKRQTLYRRFVGTGAAVALIERDGRLARTLLERATVMSLNPSGTFVMIRPARARSSCSGKSRRRVAARALRSSPCPAEPRQRCSCDGSRRSASVEQGRRHLVRRTLGTIHARRSNASFAKTCCRVCRGGALQAAVHRCSGARSARKHHAAHRCVAVAVRCRRPRPRPGWPRHRGSRVAIPPQALDPNPWACRCAPGARAAHYLDAARACGRAASVSAHRRKVDKRDVFGRIVRGEGAMAPARCAR